jgi:hypothetical protein
MSICAQEVGSRNDIVALEFMTNAQLKARFVMLTDMPPPRPMSRSLLITAVAYETLRKPHRERLIVGPRGKAADVISR